MLRFSPTSESFGASMQMEQSSVGKFLSSAAILPPSDADRSTTSEPSRPDRGRSDRQFMATSVGEVEVESAYLEGDIRMAEKKFIEAAALYEKAYGLGKNGALAMKIHAAQTQAGKPEEGEARVKQWLKENPEDLTVRFYLADAYLKASKYPAAIEEYAGLFNNLAWAYQQVKDPRALEYAEKAYQLKPDNAAVADTLGWMLVEQGKTERGLGLLEQAASLAPDAQEIRYHLAQAWLKSGDRIKARDELERILSGGAKFPQEQEAIQLLKELRN